MNATYGSPPRGPPDRIELYTYPYVSYEISAPALSGKPLHWGGGEVSRSARAFPSVSRECSEEREKEREGPGYSMPRSCAPCRISSARSRTQETYRSIWFGVFP